MRKYFITGVVILLPLALTLMVVVFTVNLFTKPFVGFMSEFLQYYGLLQKGFLILSAAQVQRYVSQFLILILLFFSTVLLGLLARWVFFHYVFRYGDYLVHQIPIVRSIYKTSKEVIRTIFATKTKSFKKVVLVPFPNPQTHAIGFVTRENVHIYCGEEKQKKIAVFVPTTPNPTSGFLMLFDPEDLIFLDMKVEDAFKYIISCGVILTPFKKLPTKT